MTLPRHDLTKILKDSGTEDEVVRLIVDLHDGTGCVVRNRGKISSRFEVTTGVRQGYVMSPVLFNLFMGRIMRETLDKFEGGGIEIAYRTDGGLFMNYCVKPDGTHKIKAPMYADDLALLGTSSSELQQMVNAFHGTCMKWGMRINTDKTKILSIGAEEGSISIAGRVLENVSEFLLFGQRCD